MRATNVQIIESMWVAWHGDDMTAWFEFFESSAVWKTREDEPDAGVYEGHGGIARLMDFWADNFDDLSVEPEEFVDAGESVVVSSVVRGRGKASGAPVELHYAFVWTLRDGKIVAVREYQRKEDALEALGVAVDR